MDQQSLLLSLFGAGTVPLIIAFVKACTSAGLPTPWAPLASYAVGIVLNMLIAWGLGQMLVVGFLLGIMAGGLASGIYSQARAGLEAKDGERIRGTAAPADHGQRDGGRVRRAERDTVSAERKEAVSDGGTLRYPIGRD